MNGTVQKAGTKMTFFTEHARTHVRTETILITPQDKKSS